MFQRILVPLDGSPAAERAIPVAASLVRRANGSLILLHIVAPAIAFKKKAAQTSTPRPAERAGSLREEDEKERIRRGESIEQAMTEAAHYLALLPERYIEELAGLTTEMHLAFGLAAPMLPSTARLERVDLMVLCHHQEAGLGQWGLESLAQRITRHSPVPVLVLNEHEPEMPALDGSRTLRILATLDGSLFAESVLEPALQILVQGAHPGQRELCLLHIVDLFAGEGSGDEETHMSPYTSEQARQNAQRYLQAVSDRLRRRVDYPPGTQITCQVTRGVDIASAILAERTREAEGELAANILIAIATHGREGQERTLLGSITERLMNATSSPVLAVCPREAGAKLLHFAQPVGGRN